MTLVLLWRQAEPPLTLRWRGPTGQLLAMMAASPERPLAAVTGPAGPTGPQGPDGIVANPDDISDFIASLDGSLN